MYGGKFAFQKLTEQACSGKEIYHFCFVLLCIRGQIPSTSPPGGLYSAGDLTEGFLRYDFGGLYLEGLINGGAYFRNFTVCRRGTASLTVSEIAPISTAAFLVMGRYCVNRSLTVWFSCQRKSYLACILCLV